MISLILTIFCSTSIGLILKHNDSRKGNPLILLAGNYFVASIICLIFLVTNSSVTYSVQAFFFGAVLALMFVISFFAFTKAVRVAGAALASVSSRLSVIVPISLSIIIFHEIPGNLQIAGLLFSILTIILFYYSLRKTSKGRLQWLDYSYLLILLLGIGINDFCMKIFQEWRPETEKSFFLFLIFTFAFIYTTGYIFFKRFKAEKKALIRGAILGVPNIFSTFFLLGALAKLPAILVYPVSNIGIILLTTTGAVIFWNEKLNSYGKWALACGLCAIVLLSL